MSQGGNNLEDFPDIQIPAELDEILREDGLYEDDQDSISLYPDELDHFLASNIEVEVPVENHGFHEVLDQIESNHDSFDFSTIS